MTHAHTSQPGAEPTRNRGTRYAGIACATALSAGLLISTAAPAAALSTTTTSAGVSVRTEMRTGVVKLTNIVRAAKGCKPLKVRGKLIKAAQGHANDMSAKNYFSHTSANGTTWDQRIRAAGYKRPAGENIAYGFTSPAGVMKGWIDSPGHRRNLLDCNFRTIGIGYNANGKFWVQNFGY